MSEPIPTKKSLELQGLRAIAVGLVVGFHLWPDAISGGYVGVDVFFVISGYLITQHLAREVRRTGTVRVTRFWGRRIRRLLPAALLVLTLSGLAVMVWLPSTMWVNSAHQIAASALYVENWALARESVDYMAQDNVPTVAQHYWSLSIEEQFYFVWPLAILATTAIVGIVGRRLRRGGPRAESHDRVDRPLIALLVVTSLASLAWSAFSTPQDQALAYLSTLTRVWEFGVGAIVALVVWRPGRSTAQFLGWFGLGAIVVAGLAFSEASAFPGWIALVPVLGAAAVILGGLGGRLSAGWWLARRPLTFIGDSSYSIYLVHWPLIVVVPMATGDRLSDPVKAGILVATIGLAWLSKTFVEDPLRDGNFLAVPAWRPFAFAALGMIVLVASDLGWRAELDRREELAASSAEAIVDSSDECLGPRALDLAQGCQPVAGTGPLVSPPEVVAQQGYLPLFDRCHARTFQERLIGCVLGDADTPSRTVALVGDSHAAALMPLMDEVGKSRGWKVVAHPKTSCPLTDARRVLDEESPSDRAASCEAFNAAVLADVTADPAITDVFVTSFTSAYTWSSVPGKELREPEVDGFKAVFRRLVTAGKRVHVIRDVPRTIDESVPDCLAVHAQDPIRCASPRQEALPPDWAVKAARSLAHPDVDVIDLTRRFCDESLCHVRIGNVIVYRDSSHITVEYSRLLAPYVLTRLERIG